MLKTMNIVNGTRIKQPKQRKYSSSHQPFPQRGRRSLVSLSLVGERGLRVRGRYNVYLFLMKK